MLVNDGSEFSDAAPAGSVARLRRYHSDPDIFGLGDGIVDRGTKAAGDWFKDKALYFLVGGALVGLGAYRMSPEHPLKASILTASGLLLAVGVVPYLFEVIS